MTAAFYDTAVLSDEVATVSTAPKLHVVRDGSPMHTAAPKKVARRVDTPSFVAGGDPLVDGAARLLSVPIRHVYAALWRIGVLEIQG